MDEEQMNCFVDCHAHLSANEFDDVSFLYKNIRQLCVTNDLFQDVGACINFSNSR